jgi:hypothetical protein
MVADLIPVNADPTTEYADMLETRIQMIRGLIVVVPPETLPSDI